MELSTEQSKARRNLFVFCLTIIFSWWFDIEILTANNFSALGYQFSTIEPERLHTVGIVLFIHFCLSYINTTAYFANKHLTMFVRSQLDQLDAGKLTSDPPTDKIRRDDHYEKLDEVKKDLKIATGAGLLNASLDIFYVNILPLILLIWTGIVLF